MLLAKLGWRMWEESSQLWARILISKYARGNASRIPTVKAQCSQVWRGIQKSKNLLEMGTIWKVGNGLTIQFWADHWLPEGPLCLNPTVQIPAQTDLEERIHSFLIADRWDTHRLMGILPAHIVEIIKSIPITRREDKVIWAPATDVLYLLCISNAMYFW